MPHTHRLPDTSYYSDDEPCRIHRDKDGDLTADACADMRLLMLERTAHSLHTELVTK